MKILVLGAGADVPNSAVTEALLGFKAAGADVVLLDSNPATLATDPDVAHRTYLEPVTLEAATRIVAIEKPDAVVATLGGPTALALGAQLGVKVLGLTSEGLAHAAQLNAKVSLAALAGWRQAELLVLADAKGTAEVAGSVELLEPMGIHPQDSLAITPARTFGPAVLQQMEALALSTIADAAVQGLSAVRLAVEPNGNRIALVALDVTLPLHTSLVGRASGRPLAVEAAKLLLGEPLKKRGPVNGRYVAVRAPRFDEAQRFAVAPLDGRARSVGEVMAVGTHLGEALMRAEHSLEGAASGAWQQALNGADAVGYAPWFASELKVLAEQGLRLEAFASLDAVTDAALWMAKTQGFPDALLAKMWKATEAEVRTLRHARGVRPTLRAQGDVWALTYDGAAGAAPPAEKTVLMLGGGPRRIGQGGELDWSCAHASRALRSSGIRVVLLDCTPAASPAEFDQICVGALAREEVLELCALLNPIGVLAQFGGQGALGLAAEGVPVLGTAPAQLGLALNRSKFFELLQSLGLLHPERRSAVTAEAAKQVAAELGYPLVVRNASGTALVHHEGELVPGDFEKFLAETTEADVELLRDKTGRVLVVAVLEHVEQAGIHSGDAAVTLPPHSLSAEVVERLKDAATSIAGALQVVGLLNVRFAVQGKAVIVLEANPRVARTVPFVAKATGLQLVELAASLALGATLQELGATTEPRLNHVAVKEAVFPFARFPEADVLLGTQMKSTGEVMGLSESVAVAFGKSQLAAGTALPRTGKVFLSVQDDDKPAVVDLGKRLKALGFTLLTTPGTHAYLEGKRVETQRVANVTACPPEVALLITTVAKDTQDASNIRREAVARGVPYFTTVEAARLTVAALEAQAAGERQYRPLQDWLSKR